MNTRSFNTDYSKLFNDIVDFSANYIMKSKLQSAVLGISGGIDSTVVAAILYEVNKRIHKIDPDYVFCFFGYSLPTKTTHDEEYLVSTFVGNAFANHFETVNIQDLSENVFDFVLGNELYTGSDKDRFRRGNIKSRMRMIYLYDRAKVYNGFVVGTDNYTEKLLGFSTIGGDALADYMPLQYFWKTEVYGLAEYLLEKYKTEENWSAVNALNASINLMPQDGLGISTSDMAQIGANNYFDVDEILFAFETLSLSYDNFVFSSEYVDLCKRFGQDVVNNVLQRRINNFKLNLPIEFSCNN
jgi:NAD+ synthetase